MEIGNSFSAYAAAMYSANNAALLNYTNRSAGASSGAASDNAALASLPNRTEAPTRRIDRSDPAATLNLSMNVLGPDGRSVSGVMQRPDAMMGNTPILEPEQSAAGLPDSPEVLFSNLASGMARQSMESITQNLSRAQDFSQQLSGDARAAQSSMQEISSLTAELSATPQRTASAMSAGAVSASGVTPSSERNAMSTFAPIQSEGRASLIESVTESEPAEGAASDSQSNDTSDETVSRLAEAASSFVSSFNMMYGSLSNSPNSSRQAVSLERTLDNAVNNNRSTLNEVGMSQNSDGALRLDEERFTQAALNNPQSIQNLFNPNSDFTREISRVTESAQDTRAMRNAEINATFQSSTSPVRNFSTYQASVQSASMVSMNLPVGAFVNMYA